MSDIEIFEKYTIDECTLIRGGNDYVHQYPENVVFLRFLGNDTLVSGAYVDEYGTIIQVDGFDNSALHINDCVAIQFMDEIRVDFTRMIFRFNPSNIKSSNSVLAYGVILGNQIRKFDNKGKKC